MLHISSKLICLDVGNIIFYRYYLFTVDGLLQHIILFDDSRLRAQCCLSNEMWGLKKPLIHNQDTNHQMVPNPSLSQIILRMAVQVSMSAINIIKTAIYKMYKSIFVYKSGPYRSLYFSHRICCTPSLFTIITKLSSMSTSATRSKTMYGHRSI